MSTYSSPFGKDFFERMRDGVASPLINQFGTTATLWTQGPKLGPEWDPQPASPDEHPVTIIPTSTDQSKSSAYMIESGDRLGLISTAGLTCAPRVDDRLEIDGTMFTLIAVDALRHGEATIFYKYHARK